MFAVLFFIVNAVFDRPSTCSSCHLMKQYVATWQTSVHAKKKADCLDCHALPGFLGRTLTHIGGARYLLTYWSVTELSAKVPNDRCLECHFLKKNRARDKEARRHYDEYITKSNACADCHRNLAHVSSVTARYAKADGSKLCGGCHPAAVGKWEESGMKKHVKCEGCHGKNGSHALRPSLPVKRLGTSAQSCQTCHRGPKNMPTFWDMSKHSMASENAKRTAAKLDVKASDDTIGCPVCHDPHTGFVRASRAQICKTCHSSTEMVKAGKQLSTGMSVGQLWTAHVKDETACPDCHSMKPPMPSSGQVSEHGFIPQPENCLQCHIDWSPERIGLPAG